MLASQHGGQTRTAEHLPAFWADGATRPLILPNAPGAMKRKVLVVDVGGTYVKLLRSSRDEREFPSGPRLKPQQLVAKLKETARGWKFDYASIGFPAPVRRGRIAKDPKHLAKGWVGFNFARALGIPVRVVNDAALQALGSYRGGRMLFLGLGTGLGSALVWDKTLIPLELGDLPYRHGYIIEVYVVLGGGLVHRLSSLTAETERGQNENAFLGGIRLWETKKHSRELKWLVL